jgi:hypothetical protein
VAFAVVHVRYGATIARVAGGLAMQFLPPPLCVALFLGGMAVGCLGGLVAARGVR